MCTERGIKADTTDEECKLKHFLEGNFGNTPKALKM